MALLFAEVSRSMVWKTRLIRTLLRLRIPRCWHLLKLRNLELPRDFVDTARFHNGNAAELIFETMRGNHQHGKLFDFVDGMCPDIVNKSIQYL